MHLVKTTFKKLYETIKPQAIQYNAKFMVMFFFQNFAYSVKMIFCVGKGTTRPCKETTTITSKTKIECDGAKPN